MNDYSLTIDKEADHTSKAGPTKTTPTPESQQIDEIIILTGTS